MRRVGLPAVAVAALLCGTAPGAAETPPPADSAVIEVTVTAIVSVAPDFATVLLTVVTMDETSVSATLRNEREVARLVAFAIASGANAADVTADHVRMAPHRPPPVPGAAGASPAAPAGADGYDAMTNLRVRWTDLSKAAAFAGGAPMNGATRVSTAYGVVDEAIAADAARQAAFDVARRKAEKLAAIAGLKLGHVVRITAPARGPISALPTPPMPRPGEPLADDVVRVPSDAPKGARTTEVRSSIEVAWSAR
ncbi:SIMPL domain-containing protein [Xanthobacter autotrophicus DSM 431]|uniref:SIMPL domain-containing protein n=1 Tax=Xanthobacter nonsaccharivorans TaxID=3119912 RepID=UPI00372AF154